MVCILVTNVQHWHKLISGFRRDLDRIRTTAGSFTDAEEVDGPSVIENMDNMKIL
jgi:hypothetical protein